MNKILIEPSRKPALGQAPTLASLTADVDLRRQLRLLWAGRKTLLLCAATVIALTWVLLLQIVPIYSANAQVMIDSRRARITDIKDVMSQITPGLVQVMSEVEVIRSRTVANRVAEKLDLDNDPEFNPTLRPKSGFRLSAAIEPITRLFSTGVPAEPLTEEEQAARLRANTIDQLLARLTVKPIPQSLVIQIGFSSPSAKSAARIANAFAENYVLDQLEAKFDMTRQASSWLNSRLEGLRQQVDSSERAVAAYRSTYGLVDNRGGQGSNLQLNELNSQLIIAQSKRAEVEARVARIESMLRLDRDGSSMDELLDSPLIQRFKEQDSQLSRDISDLSIRYGSEHPKMIKALAEQKELRSKIRSEVAKLAQGVRNELAVVRARESALREQIKLSENTVLSQSKLEIKLHELEREAQANRLLYETFLGRFKETTQQAEIQQADSRVISAARTPHRPSSPNRPAILGAAMLIGLFLGTVLVFLLEHLNQGLRNQEQVETVTGLPSIGVVPLVVSGRKAPKAAVETFLIDRPHSSFAESFRSLWINLKHSSDDHPPRVVVVTSSVPGEGKSITALSLARTVAGLGGRVLLIDGDLRRPTVARIVGLTPKRFFDELLTGTVSVSDAAIRDPLSGIDVLASRAMDQPPTELLNSQRMRDLLKQLRETYDLVVIDTPPAMAVSDVQIIAQMADKTVFCVRWDKTPKEVVRSALRTLSDVGIDVAGTLLTQVNLKRQASYGYGDIGHYYGQYKAYYTD